MLFNQRVLLKERRIYEQQGGNVKGVWMFVCMTPNRE
jgi:hypothetical protein